MADFYGKMKAEKALLRMRQALTRDGGVTPKYKILQASMVKATDKEKASAVAAFVQSGEEAYKLAGHDGFAYQDLDTRRRVGVVTYRGIEVALLFRRLVVEQELGPADPIPEKMLYRPQEEWLSVNLLDTDNTTVLKGASDQLRAITGQKNRYEALYQSEQMEKKNLLGELHAVRNQLQELQALKERNGLLNKQLVAEQQETERLKLEVKKLEQGRKDDRIKMVRELMPVFNTTWMAGLHRVGDQLYDILKKQLIEGLTAIGIEMVAPKTGDKFDPVVHNAIHSYEVETIDVGKIMGVGRIGWKLSKGPLIEPADVMVGIEKKGEPDVNTADTTSSAGEGPTPTGGTGGEVRGATTDN